MIWILIEENTDDLDFEGITDHNHQANSYKNVMFKIIYLMKAKYY